MKWYFYDRNDFISSDFIFIDIINVAKANVINLLKTETFFTQN